MNRFIIGNWKMNLGLAEAIALAHGSVSAAEQHSHLNIIIAPSFPWLVPIREALRFMPPNFSIASQVVSQWPEGAYTGDVAAKQLKSIVSYCLVGHSERRRYHHEKGGTISEQIKQLVTYGITPVVCFGEMSQSAQKNISAQITVDLAADLAGLKPEIMLHCLFAYEPLWAIGTSHPATAEYVSRVVSSIKAWSEEQYIAPFRILYGGSVTEDNAQALGEVITLDGLLVGGASLHAKQFRKICSLFSPRV